MDEVRWKRRLEGWGPVPVRTIYIRSARGSVEVGTSKEQRFEYREWRPRMWNYEQGEGPINPAARAVEHGWAKKYAGFGLMRDWRGEASAYRLIESFEGGEVRYRNLPVSHTESIVAVWAPSWFVALGSGALPARWAYVWLRGRRRERRGMCLRCGYDLRGASEKCPECGTVISKSTGGTPVPQLGKT